MGDNSVRLIRSSGAGGRSSWSATDAVLCPRHVRNNSIEVLDLARDPGLLCDTDALGVDVTGQASRAVVSRDTFDSSVPQVVKSARFCSQIYHHIRAHGPDLTCINRPYSFERNRDHDGHHDDRDGGVHHDGDDDDVDGHRTFDGNANDGHDDDFKHGEANSGDDQR